MKAEDIELLKEMAKEISSQDNLATEDPVFVVYDRKPVVVDGEYHSATTMYKRTSDFEGEFLTKEEMEDEIEEANKNKLDDDDDYLTEYDYEEVEVGDEHVFKEAFFTRKAAEEYLISQAHHLTNPYIYVESAYRNQEWKLIRRLLLNYI